MPKNPLHEWIREFRNAAKTDHLALFEAYLKQHDFPERPKAKDLLRGTLLAVVACCAYESMDGRSYEKFLNTQKYNPAQAPEMKYAYTLRGPNHFLARILTPKKKQYLDLADLYNHPWSEFNTDGYGEILISRTDGKKLTAKEKADLEAQVTYDLRYDFSEEELEISFYDSCTNGELHVFLMEA